MRKKIEEGSFWGNVSTGAVRKVTGFFVESVQYREYNQGCKTAIQGQLLPASLRAWGKEMTEENARRAFPNLDEIDAATDVENSKRNRRIVQALSDEMDMAIFHVEQDVRDLEEEVVRGKMSHKAIARKLDGIAMKLGALQNG